MPFYSGAVLVFLAFCFFRSLAGCAEHANYTGQKVEMNLPRHCGRQERHERVRSCTLVSYDETLFQRIQS